MSCQDKSGFYYLLDTIIRSGSISMADEMLKTNDSLSTEQKEIIEALICVGKIGSRKGDIGSGIKVLRKDYPDNMDAPNQMGWGQKPSNRPPKSDAEKRMIVSAVKVLAERYGDKYQGSAMIGLSYERYKKIQAAINKLDKTILAEYPDNKEKADKSLEITYHAAAIE